MCVRMSVRRCEMWRRFKEGHRSGNHWVFWDMKSEISPKYPQNIHKSSKIMFGAGQFRRPSTTCAAFIGLNGRETILLCFADSLPKDLRDNKGLWMLMFYLRTEIDCIGVEMQLKNEHIHASHLQFQAAMALSSTR